MMRTPVSSSVKTMTQGSSAPSSPSRTPSSALDEWSFAIDKTTGNVYFYNRRTRETRWTLPGEEVATSLISSLSTAHSIMKKVEEEEEQRLREIEQKQKRGGGAIEQQRSAMNGFSTPVSPSRVSQSEGKENVIREAIDPATGRKYFYDIITRRSYWEDPRKQALNHVSQQAMSPQTIDAAASRLQQQRQGTDSKTRDDQTASATSYGTKVGDISMIQPVSEDEEEKATEPQKDTFRNLELTNGSRQSAPVLADTSPTRPQASVKQPITSGTVPAEERTSMTSSQGQSLSQDRFPLAALRSDGEFNKNDLRLLKKRLNDVKLSSNSGPPKAVAATHEVRQESRTRIPVTTKPVNETMAKMSQRIKAEAASPAKGRPSSLRTPSSVAQTPSKSAGGKSQGQCLRMSGCTCSACLTGTPITVGASAVSQDSSEEGDLIPCARCARKFVPKSLAVHERICAKVFSSAKKKPENTEQKSTKEERKSTPATASGGMAKWRKQSQELRLAMQRGRGEAVDSPVQIDRSSAFDTPDMGAGQDDGLVACPHCERRFNEKAAERHIPKCTDIRSKPKTLRKGEGRAVFQAHGSSPAIGGGSPIITPKLGGELKSASIIGRKHLNGISSAANTSTISERGTSTVACPGCRRQFSSRVYERHSEVCAALNRQRLSTSSFVRPSGLRKSVPLSPASSRSSSSWDGAAFD